MNIDIEIKGIKELQSAILKLPIQAGNEIARATKLSVDKIQSNSIKEAPANKQKTTGNTLKQNIHTRMITRFKGVVSADKDYAIFVLEGTAPHIIRYTKPGRGGLYNKRTGQGFGRVVHHPGTTANRFFDRAVQRSQSEIQGYVDKALLNILNVLK